MKAGLFITNLNPEADAFVNSVTTILAKTGTKVDGSYLNEYKSSKERQSPDLLDIYNTIKGILHKSEIIIVENTQHSTGMGMILGRAIEINKPVLILKKQGPDKENRAILPMAHSAGLKKVSYKQYTAETLERVLLDFMKESKNYLSSKFLFNLSSEMSSYLQWSSEYYNRPMVDILRELISEKMSQDENWLKEQGESE